MDKLDWINSQYVKNLSPEEFKSLIGLNIPDAAVSLITERLERLSDIQNFEFFWKEPEYEADLLSWKGAGTVEITKALQDVKEIIEHHDFNTAESKETLRLLLDDLGKKAGDRGLVYWPLRVALSGKDKSPDPVDIAFVLGKDTVLRRIDRALAIL